MKKLLIGGIAAVLAIVMLIIGCSKNHVATSRNEVNLHLVPESVARSMAVAFNPENYYHTNNPTNHSPYKSVLQGHNTIENEITINDSFGKPAIYVYNFSGQNGFIFISADSNIAPVLAYIERGSFKKDIVPGGLVQWAAKTMHDIQIVRQGQYDNSKIAAVAWKKYWQINSVPEGEGRRGKLIANKTIPANAPPDDPCSQPNTFTQVGPLLPVTWGQYCTYNDLCPNYACNDCSNMVVTGCVATAMAQVTRYWSPANGFAYNYNGMPANFGNGDVQRLMHDAGVSVYMSYGCGANGGSSAQMPSIPGALTGAFGFSYATYSGYGWQDVQNDLYSNEPVILGGCNGQKTVFIFWHQPVDCHAWVCDGFMDEQYIICDNGVFIGGGDLLNFHMNWGWHEVGTANDFNGWFAFNNWNIPGAGSNGSSLNFQYATDMVKHIHP